MEVTATPATPKRPGKRAPPKAKAPLAAAPRKPAVRKSTPVRPLPPEPELRRLIAEAAYHLAASRGFAPGHEMEDWLQAERQVLGQFV